MKSRFLQRVDTASFASHGGRPKRFLAMDHHLAHAHSAIWSVAPRGSDGWPLDCLVMTCDGEGDLLSASVGEWRNRRYTRTHASSSHDSLGLLYSAVTEHMGMKPLEHEYKVMGLAPYVSDEWTLRGMKKFEQVIRLDGLTFRSRWPSRFYLTKLDRILRHQRFDAVAGGLQRLTESLLCQWFSLATNTSGLRSIAAAGGVMMNVKANGEIASLPEVDHLTVCPSAADESVAIGCAFYGSVLLNPNTPPHPLSSIYLGLPCDRADAEEVAKGPECAGLTIADITGREPETVSSLLDQGKIVGRCAGPCEFGARALGNRSILARPDRPELIRTLNEQIKNRDFWMPFAGTILADGAPDYLEHIHKSYGGHMMIAYKTKPSNRDSLRAAMHPFDYTMRPQILSPAENAPYAAIIEAFRSRTGIPAVLNTSLNLHGDPMAGNAKAALRTLLKSGLEHMVIGHLLFSKSPVAIHKTAP